MAYPILFAAFVTSFVTFAFFFLASLAAAGIPAWAVVLFLFSAAASVFTGTLLVVLP